MSAGQKVLIAYFIDMLDDWSKNSVWFMIDQKGWKYQIFLFMTTNATMLRERIYNPAPARWATC